VAAGCLVKEFSVGCGTRSFLGDDVLKFTVGVHGSLPVVAYSNSYEFFPISSVVFGVALSKLENSSDVYLESVETNNVETNSYEFFPIGSVAFGVALNSLKTGKQLRRLS